MRALLIIIASAAIATACAGTTRTADNIRQSASQQFLQKLPVCPGHKNLAKTNQADYSPLALVRKQVILARAPTKAGCLSSSFGPRGKNKRLHKGIDIASNNKTSILAAGTGTIIELSTRRDYGRMILIDHGFYVFSRYAHLSSFAKGLAKGQKVRPGQRLGTMGKSGSASGVHLHYEVLIGDYANPKASFGLKPINILAQPPA